MWHLQSNHVHFADPSVLDLLVDPQSEPVILPRKCTLGTSASCDTVHPVTLSCFEARSVNTYTQEHMPQKEHAEDAVNCVVHTGAMIWSLDWCPGNLMQGQTPCELLAVGVHPQGHTRNRLGALLHGPGIIQLWLLPGTNKSPELGYCVLHNGVVCWDLRWCPNPEPLMQTIPAPSQGLVETAGLLAIVLGDGTVQIIAMPTPPAVQQLHQHSQSNSSRQADIPGAARVLVVSLQPTVIITKEHLHGSLPSCCDWSCVGQCDQLLIGCWDGTVSRWKLPSGPTGRLQMLFHVRCDALAIRRVMWQPPDYTPCFDGCQQHNFLTAGNTGKVRIWDSRDLSLPVFDKLLFRAILYDTAWASKPAAVVGAMEDGSIRHHSLDFMHLALHRDSLSSVIKADNPGCLWSIHYSSILQCMAYSGDHGLIVLMASEDMSDSRCRRPHVPVGGLARDGDALRILLPDEVIGHPAVYAGGSSVKRTALSSTANASVFTDEMQTIYRTRFSPKNNGGACWLASGGRAGLLLLHRISVADTD